MKSVLTKQNLFIISFALLLLLIGSSCEKSEESKVKDACNQFIAGRIALKSGDSLTLKAVSEDTLYKMIMLNHQYLKLLSDVPVIEANLQMRVGAVKIDENCATCDMIAMDEYVLKLCKEGNDWKVRGENDIYPTSDMIARTTKKIKDYKVFLKDKPARDSVLTVVNSFFSQAKSYFQNPDNDLLKGTCDQKTIDVISRLHSYANQRTPPDVLKEEMQQPDFTVGDVFFEKDKATFKFYNEETYINLRKTNNSYVITGFNNSDSKFISDDYLKTHYVNLLRSLRLVRTEQYRNKSIK